MRRGIEVLSTTTEYSVAVRGTSTLEAADSKLIGSLKCLRSKA
jgi:hypothetical protein